MVTNLKAIREKNNISINDLSEKIGVNPAYICRVENGIQSISMAIAISIADFFNCSLDELVGRSRKEN